MCGKGKRNELKAETEAEEWRAAEWDDQTDSGRDNVDVSNKKQAEEVQEVRMMPRAAFFIFFFSPFCLPHFFFFSTSFSLFPFFFSPAFLLLLFSSSFSLSFTYFASILVLLLLLLGSHCTRKSSCASASSGFLLVVGEDLDVCFQEAEEVLEGSGGCVQCNTKPPFSSVSCTAVAGLEATEATGAKDTRINTQCTHSANAIKPGCWKAPPLMPNKHQKSLQEISATVNSRRTHLMYQMTSKHLMQLQSGLVTVCKYCAQARRGDSRGRWRGPLCRNVFRLRFARVSRVARHRALLALPHCPPEQAGLV